MTTNTRSPDKPATESEEVQATAVGEGETYTCDACSVDLARNVRIKCAAVGCEEVDLCPTCFCAGKEPNVHKAWHDYRVVGRHSYPILVEDWGADEELQLLDGLSKCGMGNWSAVAELIGTRTAEEVEQHYTECFLNSSDWPLPSLDKEFEVDHETFQERKKQRIVELRETLKKKPGPVQPFVSGPTNHEVGGFMPGRREFEHEAENDAEDLVKDLEFGIVLEFGGDEQPDDEEKPGEEDGAMDVDVDAKAENDADKQDDDGDDEPQVPPVVESNDSLQLKLALLDMYNERLDARIESKAIALERGLTDHKRMQQAERKRSKDDRDFINKLKPLARLQTADDFENLVAGLIYENTLKRRIAELQHYRTMGITTFAEADRYDRERLIRERARADRLMGSRNGSGYRSSVPPGGDSSQNRFKDELGVPKSGSTVRRPAAPLNLANAQSLHLLTPAEQTLCAALRILPVHFLGIKETLVRECMRRGGRLRRREARELVRIDVHKTGQIWDLLVRTGVLKLAPDIAPAADGNTASGSAPDNFPSGSGLGNPWASVSSSALAPGQGT